MPGLCKQERLFEKRLLSVLFDRGKRFTCAAPGGSLRVCYLSVSQTEVWPEDSIPDNGISCKLMVNAPKSRFKKAVTRNRIKRLLREAYRFHKHLFTQVPSAGQVLLLSFQFTGEEISLSLMRRLVEQAAGTLQKRLCHA